ncbi:RNA 2'-phosphotransferase [Flavihumibacter fluvii]|uniref:RNA 2'-phosphotransferase n=1 Tax=Flavihumibacter fluvii TaxID=2838157 RepID=UPI001BDF16BB|nr:RNA 2'-phosphotransferase [Flavihumibacter fluvii]ULQ52153.1 RNA 2'-phosphotransferase [Flavihumibacter fluvii]
MNSIDFIQLSKIVSHALRHEPQTYNLKLDYQGWVLLSDLVLSLNSKGIKVDDDSITKMVEMSEKKRHQILNGKIRAYYGHSTEYRILKYSVEPPDFLFHGTIQSRLVSVEEKGLLPMKRQYVHLSIDKKTAAIAGGRRGGELVIFKVKAKEAFLNNIHFYKEENGIWLSDPIPPKYILR